MDLTTAMVGKVLCKGDSGKCGHELGKVSDHWQVYRSCEVDPFRLFDTMDATYPHLNALLSNWEIRLVITNHIHDLKKGKICKFMNVL